MKIAICISGQPRYVDIGFNILKDKILSNCGINDVDFFVHTWWDKSMVGERFDFSQKLSYGRTAIRETDTLEKIVKLYNPKIFYHEEQKKFTPFDEVDYGLLNPVAPHSMFYSIMKSNQMKSLYENDRNFNYDLVIRTRFDLLVKNFNLNLNDIDPNIIYVSGEIHRSGQIGIPNDQFAISSSKNMDIYSDVYNCLNKYRNEGLVKFTGENILKHHISRNNLTLDFSDENKLFCDIIKI